MPTSAAFASTLLIAQAVLAAAPPLAVRLTSEIAECPASAQVQTALRQVLGDGQPSAGEWVLSYRRDPSAAGANRDASVLIELVDPVGERLVVRRIPASPGECDAIASAMAAVVERSLRTLGWTRGEPLPESARPTEATDPSTPPAREPPPRLVVGAGPSIGTSPRIGANLLLEARACLVGPLCLRLGGGLLAGSQGQDVGSGTAHLSSRYFTAAPLAAFVLGRVELAGGPLLLLAVDHGNAASLAEQQSGYRAVLAVGVAIGVALRLSPRWRVSLGLEGLRVALGADYVVMVAAQRAVVLSPSPWEGIASAKLEFVAWP
jgi:hypothetical protein